MIQDLKDNIQFDTPVILPDDEPLHDLPPLHHLPSGELECRLTRLSHAGVCLVQGSGVGGSGEATWLEQADKILKSQEPIIQVGSSVVE